jgi:hypothetical protein
MKHRQRRGDQHPQPPPPPLGGVVANRFAQDFVYGIADRSTGFIHGRHRCLSDRRCGLLHQRRQAFAEAAADGGDRAGVELNAEHLIEQALHLAMAEVVDTAQKAYQSAELRAKSSSLHSLWQLGAGCRVAMRADQPMRSWCSITNSSIVGMSTT